MVPFNFPRLFFSEPSSSCGNTAVSAYRTKYKLGSVGREVITGVSKVMEHYLTSVNINLQKGVTFHFIANNCSVVTAAKGIGNGFPMAAVITTPEIAKSLSAALHFNTFGGNPLACRVGSAVLDVSYAYRAHFGSFITLCH